MDPGSSRPADVANICKPWALQTKDEEFCLFGANRSVFEITEKVPQMIINRPLCESK